MNELLEARGQMTAFPFTVQPTARANDAMDTMIAHGIRHLPVTDAGRIVGIVSERDLGHFGKSLRNLRVSDVMTPDPFVARLDTPMSEITAEMAARKYGCAIVLDASNAVTGIFTTTDALKLLSAALKDYESRSMEPGGCMDAFGQSMYEWIEWDPRLQAS